MRCIAITRRHTLCKNNVMKGYNYCYRHIKIDFLKGSQSGKMIMDQIISVAKAHHANSTSIKFLKNISQHYIEYIQDMQSNYDDDEPLPIGAYLAYDILDLIDLKLERDDKIDDEFFDEEFDRFALEDMALDILKKNGYNIKPYVPPETFPQEMVWKDNKKPSFQYEGYEGERMMSVALPKSKERHGVILRDIYVDFNKNSNFAMKGILETYDMFDKNMTHKDMVYVMSKIFVFE